jgi:hypothetical protein
MARKVLWDTAGLQSWVRVFETEEFDLRCKSEEVGKKRRLFIILIMPRLPRDSSFEFVLKLCVSLQSIRPLRPLLYNTSTVVR